MGRRVPIRRHGRVVGYQEETSTGDIKLFSRGGRMLGLYRKGPDRTYSGSGGRYFGDGNQLMALLEDD